MGDLAIDTARQSVQIETLQRDMREVRADVKSIKEIASSVQNLAKSVESLTKSVEKMQAEPANAWNGLKSQIVSIVASLIIGGTIAALLSNVFK